MAVVKKYLSSKMPRGVAMYLLEVTRLTVELMHLDRVGDGPEVERPEVLDAEHQEGVLLAHDLAGDLQDGPGALVQALHQPGGIGLALRHVELVLAARGGGGNARQILVVDQDAGQRFGIELDDPCAFGRGSDDHIGNDGLNRLGAEGMAGLGVERAEFGDHVLEVVDVDLQRLFSAA